VNESKQPVVTSLTIKPVSLRTRINRLNRALSLLTTNNYFDSIPIVPIAYCVLNQDFSDEDLEGIYCGDNSRCVADLGENVWLAFTWFRMPSGRWEIVAYASKGAAVR
jgi:hypothetical protein